MKLWLVDLDFHAGPLRTYNQRYHVFMTDQQAAGLRAALASAVAVDPLRERDLVAFDLELVDELTYRYDEFLEDLRQGNPNFVKMVRKRWGPGGA